MPLLSKPSSFWRNLLHKTLIEQDLDEEARSYIEMLTEEKVQAGATREEAHRAALIEFGGLDQVKERVRDVRAGVFLETLCQDLRYAARALARSPGFTAVALLSLALGIGLNTAIFSTINAVLLRPLPYKDPQRLVRVEQTRLSYRNGTEPVGIAPANYLDWQEQNTVFEAMAIYERLYGTFKMATEANTAQIRGQRVSASFFRLLGVQPALGRTILDEEDKPGSNVAVLSHGLWQQHFDSDPNVLGRDITLNHASYRVIGVMPDGFRYFLEYGFTSEESAFRGGVDLWLPYPFETNPPTNRHQYSLLAIARLKPSSTLEQARVAMKLVAQRLEQVYPKENKDTGVWLAPLQEAVVGQTRPSLRLVWGAVGLVLLIACANVANLLLARAAVRKREITIRSAIGASRQRLVRQLLTESFLLALIGGTGGLVLAVAATDLLNGILPARVARFDEASLDLRVLIFALVATLVTVVLFGLIPALHGSKVQISSALAQGGRGLRGRTGLRMQRILVASQVGLSLVLLSAAGLMMNSFWRLHQIHLGFNSDNLLVFRCDRLMVPPVVTELGVKENTSGTKTPHVILNPEAMRFAEHVVERLQALPGVESAAVGYAFPMLRTYGGQFKIEGRPELSPQEAEKMDAQEFPVSPGYFQTLGIRLLGGRNFNDRDTQKAPSIVIVNQAMARGFWPEELSAIGKRIIWLGYPARTVEIVGIVEDVRSWPTEPSRPHIYVPLSQSWSHSDPFPSFLLWRWRTVTFGIRTTSDPATLATAVRNTVKEVDKSQPVEWIRTMDEVISSRFEPWRATMVMFGLFAGLAILLSAIGIYGVISYAVTERTHEIGVRMALGARPGDVLRMIMEGGFVLTLAGILLGSIAAYWLTQLISSHLFEVKPTDPLTFVCVAIVLMGVAMVACYLPARRAARQDPMAALRCD